jgi:hypothetical protein
MMNALEWAPYEEDFQRPALKKRPSATIFGQQNVSKWEHVAARRIPELMALPSGWDGYGGKPLARATAYIAINLMAQICRENTPSPSLVPMSGGGVQIEWHLGPIDLEISVCAPGQITVFYTDERQEGESEEFGVVADYEPIGRLVRDVEKVG